MLPVINPATKAFVFIEKKNSTSDIKAHPGHFKSDIIITVWRQMVLKINSEC
jgi:hypothetical protein